MSELSEPAPLGPAPSGAPAGGARPGRGFSGLGMLGLGLAVVVLSALGGWTLARADAGPAGPVGLSQAFVAAEARVAPAVVKIEVESPGLRPRGTLLPPGLATPETPREQHSLGSGVILDARGYILTNRHVINGAERIAVHVPGDPRTYYARIIGMDRDTDLAVVKIAAGRPLPVARLGDSGRLVVGDWVVAIGSPFGLTNTVTAGIVSALDRPSTDRPFETFIQTDAPINPGNSGGPLINLAGQVVGINTAIYSDSEGYQGVGFAVPSRLVESVYPQLLRYGRVRRGSIGVYFEGELSPAVRRVYGLAQGVLVSEVVPRGPAQAAGLRAGDVITAMDGVAIGNGDALMQAVVGHPIGSTVRVRYLRGGAAHEAAVRIVDRASLYPATPPVASAPAPAPAPAWGLKVEPTRAGLRVVAVASGSFGDDIGVQTGDVITAINRQRVRRRADLARWATASRPGEDIALDLVRPNGDGGSGRWLVGGTLPPPDLRPFQSAAAGR